MDSTTEGRLIAQRQVIAMIVAGRSKDDILQWLEEAMRDGQEDPGAVNEEAFAIEGALADERQALAREIRLRSGG
ncbi:hypothetical protein [Vannielia litorea]|uniref:hypothetical protein n=1 Tax=Vannielia litorea TaxID=1217970 RepID=UPI001C966E73|nr:hypothetical protein [Vannielia litorea]MBY6048178.1 hypothetical protein [Vannielia litorea]MBY6075592.1 hypothetical protein [Vannielia litorea]